MSVFSKELISWYLVHKRDLPWRETREPYVIWLSEIILQQTRVEQGKPYYFKFLERFPDVESLATASEEEVLKLWQGLGYYSRARNLHFTAKYVANELNNQFPRTYKELLQLKGVGEYTAAAIASTCFDEAVAAVDGNVFRVLARVFGLETPTNSSRGLREFRKLAQEIISREDPGTFNQAVIEFGSEHCRPQKPKCSACIFSTRCVANQQGKWKELPVKIKKQKVKKRYFNYLVFLSNQTTVLKKREKKGIWQGLYEFPLVETSKEVSVEELCREAETWKLAEDEVLQYNQELIVHKLTHQHLYVRFWIVEREDLPGAGTPVELINKFPVPVLIEKFINTFEFQAV